MSHLTECLTLCEEAGLLDEWAHHHGLHQINLPALIDRLIDLAESGFDSKQMASILIDVASDLNKVLYYEQEHKPYIRYMEDD